ncbi:hypothetical protein EV360DRAFT_68145 [Lentinula raphanica]|nr:hypothetical protein EV360DRAFT_68145 [Lentinula raphanica]
MLLIPFTSRSSSSRLCHTILLAVYLLRAFTAARPVGEEGLEIPRANQHDLLLHIFYDKENYEPEFHGSKVVKLCLHIPTPRSQMYDCASSSPTVRSWFPIRPVHLGQLNLPSEEIQDRVSNVLETLPSQGPAKLNPWEHVDVALRSLLNFSPYLFVDREDPLRQWETTLLNEASTKFRLVIGYNRGFHFELQYGGDESDHLRFGSTTDTRESGPWLGLTVFSGYLHFRNEETMKEAFLKIHEFATSMKDFPQWYYDLAEREGWDRYRPSFLIYPYIQFDKFITRLSETNSGWSSEYEAVAKAITSETVEEWVTDRVKGTASTAHKIRGERASAKRLRLKKESKK